MTSKPSGNHGLAVFILLSNKMDDWERWKGDGQNAEVAWYFWSGTAGVLEQFWNEKVEYPE